MSSLSTYARPEPGGKAAIKLKKLPGRTHPGWMNGPTNTIKKPPLFSTEPEKMNEPVPGWHAISLRKVISMYMSSKADGMPGKKRAIRLKSNNLKNKGVDK